MQRRQRQRTQNSRIAGAAQQREPCQKPENGKFKKEKVKLAIDAVILSLLFRYQPRFAVSIAMPPFFNRPLQQTSVQSASTLNRMEQLMGGAVTALGRDAAKLPGSAAVQ